MENKDDLSFKNLFKMFPKSVKRSMIESKEQHNLDLDISDDDLMQFDQKEEEKSSQAGTNMSNFRSIETDSRLALSGQVDLTSLDSDRVGASHLK